jgi:signal transduction histidine kinase
MIPVTICTFNNQIIHISNIIDNSIKYTESGEITIELTKENNQAVITVTDTGVGIDTNDLPHIFKKFERGKDASRVNVSSTGLGLYVGKSFIEAHGGSISVTSDGKDMGTRFAEEPACLLPSRKEGRAPLE